MSAAPRQLGIRSGGVELAAESVGDGHLVVCLHAGVCDRRMWRPLAERLARGHRVVAFDRRGFGGTPACDEPGSDLDDLAAVLDACAPGDPVLLVGASRGGALALDFALAHPARVAGLALLATAVSGDPDAEPVPADIQRLVDALSAAEAAGDLDAVNRIEVRLWLDGPRSPEGRVSGPLRELLLDMNGIALRAPRLVQRREPPPAYPRLELVAPPALVVHGELDFPDRVALSREVARRLPQARALPIAGAAHLPSLEQPGVCADAIAEFFAEVAGRARARPQAVDPGGDAGPHD